MKLRTIWILLGLALLTGCGGGNSSSTAPLTTRTRALQPGDKWVFDISGQTVNNNNQTLTVSGTLTESVSTHPINGTNALALQTDINATTSDGQPLTSSSQIYFTQDSSGSIVEIGDNNGLNATLRTVNTPDVVFPGTWSSSYAHTANLTFNTGETEQESISVNGTQVVQTPVGNFTAYAASLSSGGGSPTTAYWVPQLGSAVKFLLQLGAGGGSQPTITALLRSTTVPH